MLSITQKNFENEFLANAFEIDNGVVSIRWGANSGGYEKFQYFITADGGCLAIETVLNEFHKVDFNDEWDQQWHIVGVEVNHENHELYDDHTNELIPAAYEKEED